MADLPWSLALGERATETEVSDLQAAAANQTDLEATEGTSRKGGPPVRRDQPVETCPITGLKFPYYEGRFRTGSLVHPIAFDRMGYREMPVTWNSPEPAQRPLRPRFVWWNPR